MPDIETGTFCRSSVIVALLKYETGFWRNEIFLGRKGEVEGVFWSMISKENSSFLVGRRSCPWCWSKSSCVPILTAEVASGTLFHVHAHAITACFLNKRGRSLTFFFKKRYFSASQTRVLIPCMHAYIYYCCLISLTIYNPHFSLILIRDWKIWGK